MHISITDDFDARSIYRVMQAESRMKYNADNIEFFDSIADRNKHEWESESYRFKDVAAETKMTFYSFPTETGEGLPIHTLEIEVSGEEQDIEKTIRRIEGLTGIKIKR